MWCRLNSEAAGLAPVLPRGPDPVRQDGSASVACHQTRSRRTSGSVLGPLLFAVYCSPVADVITASMLTIRSSTLPCAPTTQPPDCLSSPRVLLTSDSATRRTDCSSIRTNQNHWWSHVLPTASCGLSRVNRVRSQRRTACG